MLFHHFLNKESKKDENEVKIFLNIIKHIYPNETDNNNLNTEILFNQFYINNEKIFIIKVEKSNLIIISIFNKESKNSIIKIFLLHFIISYLNFIKEISELIIINNRTFNLSNDVIKNKIFENFLFLPLKEHFQKICLKILQRKNTLQSNFKYKDFYVIELENPKILFSLSSMINKNKIEKVSNLGSLWKELLYHLTNLKHSYKEKFSNKFESSDYQDYFVKLEYTSTFPRLTFIIKFIPILRGIALIHIYSQNKISRSENENKVYKEFEIIYGNDVNKDSNHIEYRFNEPKIHKEIEMFFIEFYICSNSSIDLFFWKKHDLKYFNFDFLMIIKNILIDEQNKNNNDLDSIFYSIINKLYEEFLISKDNENKKKEEMTTKYINAIKGDNDLNINPIKDEKTITINDVDSTLKKNEMMISNYQWNFLSPSQNINSFQITKNFCLETLFSDIKNNFNKNLDAITINLTLYDDESINSKSLKLNEIIMNENSNFINSLQESKISGKINNYYHNRGKSFDIQNKNKNKNIITSKKLINSKWDNKSYILKKLSYSHFIQEENEKSNLLKNENQNDDYQMNSLSRRKD